MFLCEKNKSIILHHSTGRAKKQSIPNTSWQKIFCGLCSLNKRNGIVFMSWLQSFMTKTKVSCYKSWHCKRKTKVSSYVPLREKQKYHFTSLNWKSKTTNLSLITPDKRYFAVSVLWISKNSQDSCHDYIPLWHNIEVSCLYIPLREKQNIT